MRNLLAFAVRPAARAPLAGVLADACALAGWQALDLGHLDQAWTFYETAKAAAREAEDVAGLAHGMAEQAYVLVEFGANDDAAELVDAARRTGDGKVPALLRAWLHAAEGEILAAAGADRQARLSLDTADAALPAAADDTTDLPYLFLDAGHLVRWRGNVLARLGDTDATADLLAALDVIDPAFVRATAGLECDLAHALLARGERTEALRHAAFARTLARRTGSVRQQRRVEALRAA